MTLGCAQLGLADGLEIGDGTGEERPELVGGNLFARDPVGRRGDGLTEGMRILRTDSSVTSQKKGTPLYGSEPRRREYRPKARDVLASELPPDDLDHLARE